MVPRGPIKSIDNLIKFINNLGKGGIAWKGRDGGPGAIYILCPINVKAGCRGQRPSDGEAGIGLDACRLKPELFNGVTFDRDVPIRGGIKGGAAIRVSVQGKDL